jgi:hypothetical protein
MARAVSGGADAIPRPGVSPVFHRRSRRLLCTIPLMSPCLPH